MIKSEILLENGYKQYEPDVFHSTAKSFFQKRVKNSEGHTKYFINIYEYEHTDNLGPIYNIEVQFEKDNYFMDITLFNFQNKMTLNEIEKEIYSIWYGLDCKYYSMD